MADTTHGMTADWTPTADNINALPEPLRRYIHTLETDCDPAGTVRDEVHLRDDIVPALEQKCVTQAAEIERLTRERDDARKEADTLRPGSIMFQELAPVLAKMGVLT